MWPSCAQNFSWKAFVSVCAKSTNQSDRLKVVTSKNVLCTILKMRRTADGSVLECKEGEVGFQMSTDYEQLCKFGVSPEV